MRKIIRNSQICFFLISSILLVLSIIQYSYVEGTDNQIRVRFKEDIALADRLDQYYEQQTDKRSDKKSGEQSGKKSGEQSGKKSGEQSGKRSGEQSDRKSDRISDKRSIPDVTLWRLREEVLLTAGDYFRADGFTIIEGYGDLERIRPGQKMEGVYPPKGDTDGCAISKAGAESLYGSSDVIGKKLSIADREYIIRGIIDDGRDMLWIQNPDADGFPYVEMAYPDNAAASDAEAWLSQQGYGVPNAIMAGCDYAAFNRLFLSLPVWMFVILTCTKLRGYISKTKKSCVRMVLLMLWGVGVIILVLVGIRLSFRFNMDYIPNKWSDFHFFSEKISQLTKSANCIAQLQPLPGDTELLQHSRLSAYMAWGSMGLLLLGRLQKWSGRVR